MPSQNITSWGRAHRTPQKSVALNARHRSLPVTEDSESILPFGNGRSYGDSNLNTNGKLLLARGLNRFISFDRQRGTIRCESGVLLDEILKLVVPQGWFLSVTPGTQFVTVGGAIANDVHGKNHHVAGTFCHHLLNFELLRSDGTRMLCSRQDNEEWFAATAGGLGLTGLITWAEIQLKPISSPYLLTENIRFSDLEEFFQLSAESASDYEYTVAWIDCAFRGKRLGRGVFSRGNHAPPYLLRDRNLPSPTRLTEREAKRIFFSPPVSLVNPISLKAFNTLYFNKHSPTCSRRLEHYSSFFYPLDTVLEWNKIYGPRGFYQYQCVVPPLDSNKTVRQMLEMIAESGLGSFLAVLKQFGERPSCGMLSFPQPGTTLALDFPNTGRPLHDLLEKLDQVVLGSGGRLYPAKDGRMGSRIFKQGYGSWSLFRKFVDPRFSSDLWQRVTE